MEVDLHAQWLSGIQLNFAWRVVPDPDLQDQYDQSGDDFHRREFAIRMMQLELMERLLDGHFKAIGVRIDGQATPNLQAVPAHFFADRTSCDFDWSNVQAYGCKFEQVRVIGLPASPREVRFQAVELHAEQADEANPPTTREPDIQTRPYEVRMGRPPIIPLLREIIEELGPEALSAQKPSIRINLVIKLAKERHPNRFPGKAAPSKNTVRTALRAEGYVTSALKKSGDETF